MSTPKQKRLSITKDEWIIIGSITAIGFLFILSLPTIMSSGWFLELVPPLQYILYNLGFIIVTLVLIGIPASFLLHEKIRFGQALRSGISAWLIFSFMLDMWQPPFAYGINGSLLIDSTESLVGTSIDFMLGWIFMNLFGIELLTSLISIPLIGDVSVIFLLIYFITPICAVIIAAFLFQPKILARLLGSYA